MRRIPELDALRGLAAVAIVFYHLWFVDYGFLGTGVDLFFVISGYLITAIILAQREQPGFLVNFYGRRSLRIWPIYYLALFAFLAINPLLPSPQPTDGLPLYLTYTQNVPQYWGSAGPAFASGFHHTWSLAVEEQYYLAWPLILVLLGRRALVPSAVGLIALAALARIGGVPKWVLLTRCDGLALGGLLAGMIESRGPGRTSATATARWFVAATGISAAYLAAGGAILRGLSAAWPSAGDPLVVLSLRMLAVNGLYFGLIGLVVVRSGHRRLAWLRDPRLMLLGQMSYGIYLYHYPLFDAFDGLAHRYGPANRALLDPLKLAASFATAAASWWLVERPLLSLKKYFEYRPRVVKPTAAPREVARLETAPPGVK